jgi:hypothetical protein
METIFSQLRVITPDVYEMRFLRFFWCFFISINANMLYIVTERKKEVLYTILNEINLSGTKKFFKSCKRGCALKMTDTVKKTINGIKWRRASQLNFRSGLVMYLT